MLRVLHVTNAFPYEGVPEYGIFVKEQIDSLNNAQAGVTGDVLFVNGRQNGKKAYLEGIRELRRRAKGYDVIHCHHLYSSFVTALALTGKPTVLSFLNDWLHEMDGVSSTLARKIGCNFGAWWARRVIFKSPIPRQFVGNPRFVYLPNGVNSTQFTITSKAEARQALGLDPRKIYLLFVSSKERDRPQKRYDRFTAVLTEVRRANPDLDVEELVLVNQPRERVLNFFNAADIHLMTSDFEGSPNSVKEALCCGLAVVSTDVGNVRDMMAGVPGCAVASTFEVADLAGLVTTVLRSPAEREVIRAGFLAKDFSQAAAMRKLVAVYRDVAGAAA